VRGDREAVLAGFDNPASICLKRGTGDVLDNIDRTAEVIEYAKKKGVTLSYDVGPAPANIEVAANG
jgi:sugar/nucleoside kinase (ribokinase family)